MENLPINPYLEFFQNNKESLDNEVLKLKKLSYIRFLGENNNCFFFSYKLNGIKVIKFVFNDDDELVDIFINNKNERHPKVSLVLSFILLIQQQVEPLFVKGAFRLE